MPKLSPEELLRSIENAPTSPEEDAASEEGGMDAFDAAVAEVLAMTPAERRRELEAAGVDLEALHAETAEVLGRRPAGLATSEVATSQVATSQVATSEARVATEREDDAPDSSQVEDDEGMSLPPRSEARRPAGRSAVFWLAAAATVAAIGTGGAVAAGWLDKPHPDPTPEPAPSQSPRPSPAPIAPTPEAPSTRAPALRKQALEACKTQAWAQCLSLLDDAKRLDPDGDSTLEVQRLRAAAASKGASETSKGPGR